MPVVRFRQELSIWVEEIMLENFRPSPLIPMDSSTFLTGNLVSSVKTSCMLPIRVVLGFSLLLIALDQWVNTPRFQLILMMQYTFHTMMPPMVTSSMRPVLPHVHLHRLGPKSPLTPLLGMWVNTPQFLLIPMMPCTFHTMMPPIPT